jgi:hypothetical protein
MIDTIAFGMQVAGIGYLCYWAFKYTKEDI